MSQLFIAVPWKNEVRYQKSERNPSLKIVLTTNVRSFIKISQKMASQIVTTNEKVGDVTRANFSGQRCDRRDATSTKTRRNKVHNCIKVWANFGEDQKIQWVHGQQFQIRHQVRVFNLTTYLVISILCRAVLNLYLAVFQAVYRHWSELDVTFIFLGYVGL